MAASCVLRVLTTSRSHLLSFAKQDNAIKTTTLAAVPAVYSILTRQTSFLTKTTATQLWDSVTGVSNAGRKRGRGRNAKRRPNLNIGQRIGQGKAGMVFPGLTGPILVGKKKVAIHTVEKREDQLRPVQAATRKREKIPALQRGYSGRKFPGTSIGAPDPIYDYVFEGFDTKVLEYKMVSHMTGNLGRRMRSSALVVTGNKNGLAGFAVAKAPKGTASLRKAKNMAAQRLQFIELYNGHTVFHNFATREGHTTVFVQKMPEGYGLSCHRVIKTVCETIGIKDLHVVVEGRKSNIQNMVKAFFRGLMEQESHQQLADRMKLNVVEYREEFENIPITVASPSDGVTREESFEEEAFDFENMYYKDGKIPLKKAKDPMAVHTRTDVTWKQYLKVNRDRNQMHARYLRMVHSLEPSKDEIKMRMLPLK